MKRFLAVLLAVVMLIGCAQSLAIRAEAASISVTGQAQRLGWFSSFLEWLLPSKKDSQTNENPQTNENSQANANSQTEEVKTVESEAKIIIGTPPKISEYDAYRLEVEKIDNSALRNTPQLHRYPIYESDKGQFIGLCNMCSMETLLNRRVAYDFGDYSSPFDDNAMFNTLGVKDLDGGVHIEDTRRVYKLNKGIGTPQDKTTFWYSDSVAYRSVELRTSEVKKMANETGLSGLDAQYAAIAAMLRKHPEGVWIRSDYGKGGYGHAILVTDYKEENGAIQLFGIDPVDVRDKGWGREPIEKLWFYGNNYKNGLIGGGPFNITYLKREGEPDETFTVVSVPAADGRTPTLSVTGQNAPETLNKGDNFGLRGTVKTDCGVITSVYGEITDLSGNVIQNGQHYPNKASDNLRYSVNNDLTFNRLDAGSYVYRVRATAKNGSEETTQTLIESQFQVRGAQDAAPAPENTTPPATEKKEDAKPSVWVSGENLPGNVNQGGNFGIRGTVSTNCGVITSLRGSLLDAAGNEVQYGQYYPNASSADLRYTINDDLVFGYLAPGEYTYCVRVTAQNGSAQTTEDLIKHTFQVVGQEQPKAIAPAAQEPARTPVLSVSGQNLPENHRQGKNFGIRGTVSTDCGTITELYGAIWDAAGNTVCSGWYSPYSSSVDLRTTINNDLIFDTLGAGTYTYYVQARAENNGQQTVQALIQHTFTVESGSTSQQAEPALNAVERNMTVNVGKGSTLRLCSTVSTGSQYELGSLPNGAVVYVYGTTQQQYENRTWAKVSYNGTDGWVNYKWLS